ncbi:hypothetical protein [Victivallis vadensis]|uniref:hypothetical protein n=1 Tax=Victivallis vadensis TaxID=172901 RepID=UPI003CFD2189
MRMTFDFPDEWVPKLEEEAARDGHKSLSAVCRKAISFFLFSESSFVNIDASRKMPPPPIESSQVKPSPSVNLAKD